MRLSVVALTGLLAASAALADPDPSSPPAPVDLTGAFHTRTPWRLIATQGPPTEDYGGEPAPGKLGLCLEKGGAGDCLSAPVLAERPAKDPSGPEYGPHYLLLAKAVYPQGPAAPPLLQIVTTSLRAVDGGQIRATQVLKYDRGRDAFERVYLRSTGTNHNEQVRFIDAGPLKGDVISADPTENAPYGYWVTVNQLTPARTYRQTLRYRSSTHYNDGNQLAVIDSEMPNIQRRLGLWKPGSPLPLPAGKPCLHPTLKRSELWCG